MRKPSPNQEEGDLEVTLKDDARALIPEGRYQVGYIGHERNWYFGGWKLYVKFTVCDLGPFNGTQIFRAYNYEDRLPVGSDLYKDLTQLYGARGRKNMKLSVKKLFQNRVLEVHVRTVNKDRKQKALPKHQQYSVVDQILRVVAGGESEALK